MKLIIEVPEEEYNTRQLLHYFGCYSDKLDLVIYNGTPLPEGHGRIVDIDEVIKCIEEAQGADVVWALNLIEWACSKRTIIEADKEGDNE